MRFRWTMKELNETSPELFIEQILNERSNELNPYSPLANKLKQARTWLSDQQKIKSESEKNKINLVNKLMQIREITKQIHESVNGLFENDSFEKDIKQKTDQIIKIIGSK